MADAQSKLDKLIAAGATPEELAQVRAEDELRHKHKYKGTARFPETVSKKMQDKTLTDEEYFDAFGEILPSRIRQDIGRPSPDPLTPEEYAERVARMRQKAQAAEEQKFNAQNKK
jgi:hypothetical protein